MFRGPAGLSSPIRVGRPFEGFAPGSAPAAGASSSRSSSVRGRRRDTSPERLIAQNNSLPLLFRKHDFRPLFDASASTRTKAYRAALRSAAPSSASSPSLFQASFPLDMYEAAGASQSRPSTGYGGRAKGQGNRGGGVGPTMGVNAMFPDAHSRAASGIRRDARGGRGKDGAGPNEGGDFQVNGSKYPETGQRPMTSVGRARYEPGQQREQEQEQQQQEEEEEEEEGRGEEEDDDDEKWGYAISQEENREEYREKEQEEGEEGQASYNDDDLASTLSVGYGERPHTSPTQELHMMSSDYRRGHSTSTNSLYAPPAAPKPKPWEPQDSARGGMGTVLRFLAYTVENNEYSFDGSDRTRVRELMIMYYLKDGEISIVEPRKDSTGLLWASTMKGGLGSLRRGKVPRADGSGTFYELKDLTVGSRLLIYGRDITVVDADEYTRTKCARMGIHLEEGIPIPQDEFSAARGDASTHGAVLGGGWGGGGGGGGQVQRPDTRYFRKTNFMTQYAESLGGKPPPDNGKARQFLAHPSNSPGGVLRFYAVWDDRQRLFGDVHRLVLLYFLSDDSMELLERHERNSGYDRWPKLLRRMKVPRDAYSTDDDAATVQTSLFPEDDGAEPSPFNPHSIKSAYRGHGQPHWAEQRQEAEEEGGTVVSGFGVYGGFAGSSSGGGGDFGSPFNPPGSANSPPGRVWGQAQSHSFSASRSPPRTRSPRYASPPPPNHHHHHHHHHHHGAGSNKFMTWRDVVVGEKLSLNQFELLVVDADPYTRDFIRRQTGRECVPPLVEDEYPDACHAPPLSAEASVRMTPPSPGKMGSSGGRGGVCNGQMSSSSSQQGSQGQQQGAGEAPLVSTMKQRGKKARKEDWYKPTVGNSGNTRLRFQLKLSRASSRVQASRLFVLDFFLEDGSLLCTEIERKNNGFPGGKFLRRNKYINPETGRAFTAGDLEVGRELTLNHHSFMVVAEDQFTSNHKRDGGGGQQLYLGLGQQGRSLEEEEEEEEQERVKTIMTTASPAANQTQTQASSPLSSPDHTADWTLSESPPALLAKFREILSAREGNLTQMFLKLDDNGNGKVELNELKHYVRLYYPAISERSIEELWDLMDPEGKGGLLMYDLVETLCGPRRARKVMESILN